MHRSSVRALPRVLMFLSAVLVTLIPAGAVASSSSPVQPMTSAQASDLTSYSAKVSFPEDRVPVGEGAVDFRVGRVVGQVKDVESGMGVSDASVWIEGAGLGAVTGNLGRYRIDNVPAGTHTVVVRKLGYADMRTSVRVTDGGEVVADFALEVSALPLDELVVTGTAFAAKVRTLPNPINVITAAEIQAKGATKLEDLLRGEIPGVMALSWGQEDYFSYIYVRGNASGSVQDLIKIYVDGVELASAEYLSTLDLRSIDRIEVVRGPQASAIYGSEAASGVLQIFTKKGTPGLSRPRLDFQASTGVIESAYIPTGAGTPRTSDYSVGVSGGGESFSYRAGGGYSSVGEWVKHYGSKTLSLSGGLRAVQGPLTVDLTALWSDRENDYGNTPVFLRWPNSPTCARCGNPDFFNNSIYELGQSTMAMTLRYQATSRWQHSLTLGDDQNRRDQYQPRPSFNTPADTFVVLFNQELRRRQVRYHTAYEGRLGEGVTARWTAGADYWNYDVKGSRGSNLLQASGTVRGSSNSSYTIYNDNWWNAGVFGMAELGFGERLNLTLAGRVEDNPNLGEDYGRAFVPRAGASYVQSLGAAEVKLRAQWGKGVRPPPPLARTGQEPTATSWTIPNPDIAPEEKVGWDAGVDVFWGNRASLSVTRYDEEARNLIVSETIDPTSTPTIRQFRNIGLVGLQGWEVEGDLTLGRVTLSANYAYSDVAVREVDAATAANPNAGLQVGDRTNFSPKHSGGGRVTARVAGATVGVDASVMAGWRMIDFVAFYNYLYGGEPYRGSTREYYVEYPSLWKWNLRAERPLGDRWQGFLRVENLAGNQSSDFNNVNVTPGRTTVLGVRWSM
jgi:TonB-dependent starch-binding outer membrane protein SusC